jgi:hypothetical protein
MQAPTHILTGVIIQRAFARKHPRALWLGVTAVLAFLSHGILDKLARVTYHPPNADFHSAVWVVYHSCLVLITIFFLYLWWKPYKWGIIFACLPDVDWVFIHGQEILHIQLPFYRTPHLHHLLGLIFDRTPPFTLIDKLPNYRHQPWAGLWELMLVIVLGAVLFALNRPKGLSPSRMGH